MTERFISQSEQVGVGQLRVLTVAAPEWPTRANKGEVRSLKAENPLSIQHAVRKATHLAMQGAEPWSNSNLSTPEGRADGVIMYHHFDEAMPDFEERLGRIKPNLLLIGAMTPSIPGAIEMAKKAKEMYGDDITIA